MAELCEEAWLVDCDSGIITADTGDTDATDPPYATDRLTTYECASFTYEGNEFIFAFIEDGDKEVTVTTTRLGDTGDFDLYALDGTGASCAEETRECLDRSTGMSSVETVEFSATAGETVFIVYDLYGTGATETTEFELAIRCAACGDGFIDGAEECDDGNTTPSDGCSDHCTIEPGRHCAGEPSHCWTGGETCDEALPASAGSHVYTTAGYDNDYDDYLGLCSSTGYTASGADMVFVVSVPDGATLSATMDGIDGWNEVVAISSDCPDTTGSCLGLADYSFDMPAAVTNTSGADVDHYIVADGYFSTSEGEFSLDITVE